MTPTVTLAEATDAAGGRHDGTFIRAGLTEAARRFQAEGAPVPALEGKLLRPTVAYALVPPSLRPSLDGRFWIGALAVQMVHEASLLHDDILDDASERRGDRTLVATKGVGPALVLGDHYLTGAYRAAAMAEAPTFLDCFIRAVERTVAGEVQQGRTAGRRLARAEYDAVVAGKSGELFGAATCLGGALFGLGDIAARVELGREIGALYQQVDDLLDYCPVAVTGKPPLQDYGQGKWTWVLELADVQDFSLDNAGILAALFGRAGSKASPARRALQELRTRRDALVPRAQELSPGDEIVARLIDAWVETAARGVEAQERSLGVHRGEAPPTREAEVVRAALEVGGPEAWPEYFGRHAKTFRFAARLFPPEPAARTAGVYAFCRFTDDLVDDPADGAGPDVLGERLAVWSELSRAAYDGAATGIPLLDTVVGESGRRGVHWRYPEALLRGVGMDLRQNRYADWAELEVYTFGVAGAVGGWITQLFGLDDEALLERAHALGHGMQLTNILRDVGEDWRRGRVYLPEEVLGSFGFSAESLGILAEGDAPIPPAYRALVGEVMARADAYYEEAWPGIRALPGWYRRPVAVAAQAYRGIHREIVRNGYDNLRRRARTSMPTKIALASGALVRSHVPTG
ncbi:MAG TPA: squalene/phytoene synthase family protein [Longimicrobiales bacterium]|nr:squalene/phytoene synthase family protein [Longimicrobiales bacterium]